MSTQARWPGTPSGLTPSYEKCKNSKLRILKEIRFLNCQEERERVPGVRIVLLLRDPIDMLFSWMKYEVRWDFPFSSILDTMEYQLSQILTHCLGGEEDILVVHYEDLVRNTDLWLTRMYEHLRTPLDTHVKNNWMKNTIGSIHHHSLDDLSPEQSAEVMRAFQDWYDRFPRENM